MSKVWYDTCAIFSQALNKKIFLAISASARTENVLYTVPQGATAKYLPSKFVITVPKGGVGMSANDDESYALLGHGLGHVIFGTNLSLVNFHRQDENKKFKTVANILEDTRTEDCMSFLYKGTYDKLCKMRPKCTDIGTCVICKLFDTSVEHLLGSIRAGKFQLCTNPPEKCVACKEAMEMVSGGKSIKATIAAIKKLEKFIDEEIDGGGGGNVYSSGLTPTDNIEMNFDPKEFEKTEKQLLEEAADEFWDALKQIQQALNNTKKKEKIFGKIIDHQIFYDQPMELHKNPKIKLLRKHLIDLKYKQQLIGNDDSGEQIDVDEVIKNRITGENGEIFLTDESTTGLEMNYVIDLSGSMDGEKLDTAKQALYDMHELSKGLFTQKIFGFGGSAKYPTITMVEEVPHNKIASLGINGEYCYTHTHHAVQVASQRFDRTTDKRVIVILTDGVPMCASSAYTEAYMRQLCKKAIDQARKQGIRVFTILVGRSIGHYDIMTTFGRLSTVSVIENPEEIYTVLKDETIKNLLKTIYKG